MGRLITDILREYRGGRLVNELTEELAELVQTVMATDKPGTLTLKLSVKPDKGGENQLTMQADYDTKLPKADFPSSTYFADQDGSLTRTDPNQSEMTLSEVKKPDRHPGMTGDKLKDISQNEARA